MMLQGANFVARQAGMNLEGPATLADLRPRSHVLLLRVQGTNGLVSTNLTGSIRTPKFFVGYDWGQPANFWQRGFQPDSEDAIRALNARLSALPSLVDTNGAVQVAVERFKALGIDTTSLQARCAPTVIQDRLGTDPHHLDGIKLPLFELEWRVPYGDRSPDRHGSVLVAATVLGATRELIGYHIMDQALFLRPPLRILNAERLLSMPDASFEALSEAQRSNLVFEASPQLPRSSPPADVPSAASARAGATNTWGRP
jgi:hypothetical protein